MNKEKSSVDWIKMDENTAFKIARSFLQKAENDFLLVKECLEKHEKNERSFYEKMWQGLQEDVIYPQSISLSLECIEFSIKAIFLIFLKKFPKIHGGERKEKIEEVKKELIQYKEEINKMIKELSTSSTQLKGLDFDNIFSLWNYWMNNYTKAKYGDEENLV